MIQRNIEKPVEINLDGPEGNAYYVLGFTKNILKQFKDEKYIDEILNEMKTSDYINLIKVAYREIGGVTTWITDNNEYLRELNKVETKIPIK